MMGCEVAEKLIAAGRDPRCVFGRLYQALEKEDT